LNDRGFVKKSRWGSSEARHFPALSQSMGLMRHSNNQALKEEHKNLLQYFHDYFIICVTSKSVLQTVVATLEQMLFFS
jgi:hypothetical protein